MTRSPPFLFLMSAMLIAILAVISPVSTKAFLAPTSSTTSSIRTVSTLTTRPYYGSTSVHAKKPKEDLSYIETRDMTREEMLELNKKNEEIMNMELSAMTGFSLVLSLPILYLCWVAFFSD